MYEYFETVYNDQVKNFLHYVTAREMYNLVKAVEADAQGNPDMYRDFEIPKYVYVNG